MKPQKNRSVRIAQPVKPVKQSFSFSVMGKKVLYAGMVTVIAGFVVLTRTDPAGANWASSLSPFLIIGGYVLVGVSLIIPERSSLNSDSKARS